MEVDCEPTPPVLDVRQGMEPGSPLLHDNVYTDTAGSKATKPSNIAAHLIFEEGDIEKGFAEAEIDVERHFRTATVHQGYIEPHHAVAEGRKDGQLTVRCSTQGAFPARAQLAQLLDPPV